MPTIPKKLEEFIGIHKGESIVVCGCGTSLLKFKEEANNFITIGVNDVSQLFIPNYLLVTDGPTRFYGKRETNINNSGSKYLFTCTKGWRHPNQVYFKLGYNSPKSLDSKDSIDHFLNSPYVAIGLAYKFGAKKIGLVGVDFTKGHFYNEKDGDHPIVNMNYLKKVDDAYLVLKTKLLAKGVQLFNLSSESRLLSLPKISIEEFKKL
jgi:hypothetical protein